MCYCCENDCDEPLLLPEELETFSILPDLPRWRSSKRPPATHLDSMCVDFIWGAANPAEAIRLAEERVKNRAIKPRTGRQRLKDERARMRCRRYGERNPVLDKWLRARTNETLDRLRY